MDATGIGFAGIDGTWWLPSTEPAALPEAALVSLPEIGRALFALLDTVGSLYPTEESLRALLNYRVPPHVPWIVGQEPVLLIRPDFQLVPDGASYRLVATEIESCPSAQGFAHAMQVGYQLATDLADEFARFLDGRPLLIAGTDQWSEFLFDQLAFCRALSERGAAAFVLYDRPIADIAADVASGRRWTPPLFGVPSKTAGWSDDIPARIDRHDLADCLWPGRWPDAVGDAVVFRFGYFDCFERQTIDTFLRWQHAGATFLNPPITYLESKAVLATVGLPAVREYLRARHPGAEATLDRSLPQTLLLERETLPTLLDEREAWLIKYAGFDGDNQAWGGRSVLFGREHTAGAWADFLRRALELPWPVVAQRLVSSVQVEIDYYDRAGDIRRLTGGHTRLRSYLLRRGGEVLATGNHLTVSVMPQVSEAIDAVQAPVVAGLWG